MIKKILKVLGAILLIIVFAVAALVGYLTVDEYKPDDVEKLEITGTADANVELGKDLKIVSWNIGYGALGDNADFFMDGGKSVSSSTKQRVNENLAAIAADVEMLDPDFIFFQELDRNSTRSYFVDEAEAIKEAAGKVMDGHSTYGVNYRAAIVPYPIPPIGKVECGLYSASKYEISDAERIQLPVPFSWPFRTANLKRCLSVMRAPVSGSDKELVLVNLHLEAYDEGDGKIAQTNMLKEFLQKEIDKGNYVIAGGDFNQSFSNIDISLYPQLEGRWAPSVVNVDEFGDDVIFYSDNSTPTCRSLDIPLITAELKDPEHFQYYMLDGFIVSSNVTVSSVSTIDLGFKNADHNPVELHFTLQ